MGKEERQPESCRGEKKKKNRHLGGGGGGEERRVRVTKVEPVLREHAVEVN